MSDGYYEMEFCHYESDLHEKMDHCVKHPDHCRFYPVSGLCLQQYLPMRYHNSLWLDYINAVISLTVRLVARCTSRDRLDDDPCAGLRGIPIGRFGTGRVTRTVKKFANITNEKCPCKECKEYPGNAKRQWGKFEVLTALHVVYNDEECKMTTCDVGLDTYKKWNTRPKLEGVEVIRSDKSKDLVMISCIVHDEAVCNELETAMAKFYGTRRKLQDVCKRSGNHGDLSKVTVVCVSHPHGMSKHITVGEWTGQKDKDPPHKWTYTAETCGGSSGAPVFMLGGCGLSCTNLSTHTMARADGTGECGWEGWHL